VFGWKLPPHKVAEQIPQALRVTLEFGDLESLQIDQGVCLNRAETSSFYLMDQTPHKVPKAQKSSEIHRTEEIWATSWTNT